MKILYCRISKDEMSKEESEKFKDRDEFLESKWQQQKNVIMEKFNIDRFDKELYDSGSAYRVDEFKKRETFSELLEVCFDFKRVTLYDLFSCKYDTSDGIEIYVYDYNRISRLIEYSMLFSVLCDLFSVRVFSVNQNNLEKEDDENVRQKGVRYIFNAVNAMSSEDYSEAISKNTKKAMTRRGAVILSPNNAIWGKGFRRTNGEKLTTDETIALVGDVVLLIDKNERKGKKRYYDSIISKIVRKHRVELSRSSITKIKQRR